MADGEQTGLLVVSAPASEGVQVPAEEEEENEDAESGNSDDDEDMDIEQSSRLRYSVRVRVGGYIVNLLDFYSYRLIGKLTAFLQVQEFSQRNLPVEDSFTFAARLSLLG
jgi:hypothetical protein